MKQFSAVPAMRLAGAGVQFMWEGHAETPVSNRCQALLQKESKFPRAGLFSGPWLYETMLKAVKRLFQAIIRSTGRRKGRGAARSSIGGYVFTAGLNQAHISCLRDIGMFAGLWNG